MIASEKYLLEILPRICSLPGEKRVNGRNAYKVPCPFCSGAQKKDYKRNHQVGLFFFTSDGLSVYYKCARCLSGRSLKFSDFLKQYDPRLFLRYWQERDQKGSTGRGHDLPAFGSGQFWSPSFNSGDQSTSISVPSPDNHSSSSD